MRCGSAMLAFAIMFGLSQGACAARAPIESAAQIPTDAEQSAFPDRVAFSDAVEQVAARVRPAVVHISREQVVSDPLGRPFTVAVGVGSGVIYDAAGHILTNAHVVDSAGQWRVDLPDGRTFPGSLIGADAKTDLAVLQISADALPVAPLGDSGQLQLGEWVIAIGNAYGLDGGPTISAGIVSGTGRTIAQPTSSPGSPPNFLFDLIQTDAAISPGNSGGPLANLDGQVVGINTLANGEFGLAIGSNTANQIAAQLVATGQARHAFLGADYMTLDPYLSGQVGVKPDQKGVLVRSVDPGSPSEQAGLRPPDLITAVDGIRVPTDLALAEVLNVHKPGDAVTLQILRQGEPISLIVTLAASK